MSRAVIESSSNIMKAPDAMTDSSLAAALVTIFAQFRDFNI